MRILVKFEFFFLDFVDLDSLEVLVQNFIIDVPKLFYFAKLKVNDPLCIKSRSYLKVSRLVKNEI